MIHATEQQSHFYALSFDVQPEPGGPATMYGNSGTVTPRPDDTTLDVFNTLVRMILRDRGLDEDTPYIPRSFTLLPNDPRAITR